MNWLRPLAYLIITGSLLGVSTTLAKLAGQVGLPAPVFLAWSVAGAALTLSALSVTQGQFASWNQEKLKYFVVSALLSVAGPNLIFFSAVPHVGASFVSLAIAFPPLLTYVGASVLGMERLRVSRAAGVLLAMAGAIALAVAKLQEASAPVPWVLATFLGPVLLAAGNLYRSLRWPAGSRPEALAPGMLSAAAAMLMVTTLAFVPAGLTVPMKDWAPTALIVVQAATFALQYRLFFVLQQVGGPVYMSLLGSVGAVVTISIAVVLMGEPVPGALPAGALLIATGMALVIRGQSISIGPPREPGGPGVRKMR